MGEEAMMNMTTIVRQGRSAAALVLLAGLAAACGSAEGEVPPDAQLPERVLTAERGPASPGEAVTADDAGAAALPTVTVYKSPTCGCCSRWVEHMREAGFEVVTHDVSDLSSVKAEHGVPAEHESCHTAIAGDYVVEGHVPADLVRRLVEESPDVAGLAVPGMPRGSPGMEVPDGTKDTYDVIAFSADGSARVYASR